MSFNHRPKKAPWYERYDKIVQWVTLLSVTAGAVGHYLLVDRPAVSVQEDSRRLVLQSIEESKRNQQLIEKRLLEAQANTEALRANIDQIRAQTQLSKATVEQIQDPARKATEALQLEHQRLERMRITDELIDSLVPNLQVKLRPEIRWQDRHVSADFVLTNAGARAIRIDHPVVSITLLPSQAGKNVKLPASGDLRVSMCEAGFVSPGETINCAMVVNSNVSLSSVGSMSYRAEFSARTDLPEASETSKRVRAAYDVKYLDRRMSKQISFDGNLWRE
jgi:hypothetical protein